MPRFAPVLTWKVLVSATAGVAAFPGAVGFGAADAAGDFDATGYTNVEKHLDGLLDGSYR